MNSSYIEISREKMQMQTLQKLKPLNVWYFYLMMCVKISFWRLFCLISSIQIKKNRQEMLKEDEAVVTDNA